MYTWSILLFILLIVIFVFFILFNKKLREKFNQAQDEHRFAHFGGTPNQSQIWPNMVKYPKQYV